jgi:gamma-butyrobetaine dioxygenase
VTIIDRVAEPSARLVAGRVQFCHGTTVAELHPLWLRHRSTEPGQVEPTNRQRLFTPVDLDADLGVVAAEVCDGALHVAFTDGHLAHLDVAAVERALGWRADPEEPPAAEPWTRPLAEFPYVDWNDITFDAETEDLDAVIDFLVAFFRHGYVVFRNTPAEVGTVERVADRLGYIVGHNFGWVFDVEAKPSPTDLAYTAIELLAHSDEPYRRPVPGIQMLHCIANEAPRWSTPRSSGATTWAPTRSWAVVTSSSTTATAATARSGSTPSSTSRSCVTVSTSTTSMPVVGGWQRGRTTPHIR